MMLCGCSLGQAAAQLLAVSPFLDTTHPQVREATAFLQRYAGSFPKKAPMDFCQWFTPAQCRDFPVPDPIIHAISSDGNTYRMADLATIFYAQPAGKYTHLKTLFAWQNDAVLSPFAIANHYVYRDAEGVRFHTELEHHATGYRTVVNGPVYYTFPAGLTFNKQRSDSLLRQMQAFEKEWGFKPAKPFRYYFAQNARELARMKGLDFAVGSDEAAPSGYADEDSRIIYCQGLGEAYFHEVLHLYLNPVYGRSPLNHGLIYYLAGGLGETFAQQLTRLRGYLEQYPQTNLAEYDKIVSKDRFLHIDHIINGLLCGLVYEKEGVAGVERLLDYPTLETLFRKEYGLERKDWDAFLRAKIHSSKP